MFGPRRCGGGGGGGAQRWAERTAAAAADGNRYAETDPTGRYGRFNELLGKGAMKSVYRGFDEVNGVEVAWNQAKLCDVLRTPDALQRMYSEVHLLSTLRHDAVIGFHASWVDVSRRTFNFITEMFTSGTLREYRLRYPRVSIRAVKSWARQILQGLAYLHSHDPPVIHRDLKCDNIFINGHLGQVKIGDLGLAAVLRGTQSAHSVIGTPEFMAPELYEEDYNELVDIYSFGMCMLEMLTLDYPYSECCNPAQIYKKVTSGKLPDAYYRLEDKAARRFIGRCLVAASKRPSAEELLHDPFLSPDDHTTLPSSAVAVSGLLGAMETPESDSCSLSSEDEEAEPPARTDMTITGKLNHEDDTIFLKVQIADDTGYVRNIYFPYDMLTDTAIDVANEMVKELEITDRDPSEIAAMIEQEIAMLVPGWTDSQQQECTYTDDDENEDGECPPFYYLSSSPTSSQGSLCGVGPSRGFSGPHGRHSRGGLFQDDYPFTDDDGMSSTHSGKYSALHYMSGHDEAQPEEAHGPSSSRAGHRATRFGPDDSPRSAHSLAHHFQRQCHGAGGEHRRRLTRNRSMVDVRSQLLHRTLVEELNKRLFNTVGAVEDIGFRVPCYGSSSTSSSRRAAPPSSSSPHGGDHRRLKEQYRLL